MRRSLIIGFIFLVAILIIRWRLSDVDIEIADIVVVAALAVVYHLLAHHVGTHDEGGVRHPGNQLLAVVAVVVIGVGILYEVTYKPLAQIREAASLRLEQDRGKLASAIMPATVSSVSMQDQRMWYDSLLRAKLDKELVGIRNTPNLTLERMAELSSAKRAYYDSLALAFDKRSDFSPVQQVPTPPAENSISYHLTDREWTTVTPPSGSTYGIGLTGPVNIKAYRYSGKGAEMVYDTTYTDIKPEYRFRDGKWSTYCQYQVKAVSGEVDLNLKYHY